MPSRNRRPSARAAGRGSGGSVQAALGSAGLAQVGAEQLWQAADPLHLFEGVQQVRMPLCAVTAT